MADMVKRPVGGCLRRRVVSTGLGLLAGRGLVGAVGASAAGVAQGQSTAGPMLTIFADRQTREVNPLILGNNVDWSYSAQGLLQKGGTEPVPAFLALADRLAPTALRYPGGTNSDFYQWRNGIGPYAQRKPTRTLEGKEEVIGLGTDEYLALCQRWGSEPLITVNLATGSAQDAADWVHYTNRRESRLPRVRYWEIGNEPYLEAHFKDAAMSPAEYARRVNAHIRAMKAVDPDIQVGVALRNDTLGGVEATPFQGFNETVLAAVREPFEFASLHSSYFPVTFEKKESEAELFEATMAGTRVMAQDMQATRDVLGRHHPGRRVRLAITEYNALYSLDILKWGLASVFLSKTDRYIESLAGALFTADALRVFSQTDDLLMANFWSLCGNWWYGAISHEGRPRPQFHILEAYRELARGALVHSELSGVPTMATARSGFVPEQAAVPTLEAHATRSGGAVRVAVINKHPRQSQALGLDVRGLGHARASARVLSAKHYFGAPVTWVDQPVELRDGRARIEMPRHSFALIRIDAS